MSIALMEPIDGLLGDESVLFDYILSIKQGLGVSEVHWIECCHPLT